MKALVAGWFSFQGMGTTAGDLMARDVACGWLDDAGRAYDVAVAPPFQHEAGVDWRGQDPRAYDCVLFVCGPVGNGPPVDAFLRHFRGCRLIGLDLSMLQPLREWNPFDFLIERDSDAAANPDLAMAARQPKVPVVGVILAHAQKEYGPSGMHAAANAAFHRLTRSRPASVLYVDTCLDPWNANGMRSAAEVESLIAKADVVLTTRLHGLVLALKNGVPPVVIDPVRGGAKLRRQAEVLGWPLVFNADAVSDEGLARAYDHCITPTARAEARACAERAVARIDRLRERFLTGLSSPERPPEGNPSHRDPAWRA
jgi:hypothetical protein